MRIPRRTGREAGIALFMIMSALAVLTIVIAELTYSMHMQSQLAYNYTDGLKAYYSAKAAMKVGLLRLSLYKQIKAYLGNEQNRAIAAVIPTSMIEKIWNFPFIYPVPIPDNATQTQKDALKQFEKDSSMEGQFQVNIASEGSRLNMNNLLITAAPSPSPSPSSGSNSSTAPAPSATPTPTPSPTGTANAEVDFKPIVEDSINQILNRRRTNDQEFAQIYRDTNGRDIMEAIHYYIKYDREKQGHLMLPGANEMVSKDAPLYSMSELHFIPGLDDTLYDLIEPAFTTFSTPGININTISKATLWSLVHEFTEEDINAVMTARDDPEQGKPFDSVDKFWEEVGKTSVASRADAIKERLTKAGLQLTTAEQTFRVMATAMVGQSTRNIEARVVFSGTGQNSQGQRAGTSQSGSPNPTPSPSASANANNGLNLVYWRAY